MEDFNVKLMKVWEKGKGDFIGGYNLKSEDAEITETLRVRLAVFICQRCDFLRVI